MPRRLKVLLMGPTGAGKTAYLRALDEDALLMVDKKERTVGFDMVKVYFDPRGRRVVRERRRFRDIREVLMRGATGSCSSSIRPGRTRSARRP